MTLTAEGLAAIAERLERHFGVTLRRLAPVDEGDWCEHCHALAATVEDSDGHRFCDARCAEEWATAQAEAAEQRNIERFYGG